MIFDVSKEDLRQLIRFDDQKNFLEDFISEIDGEIITLINGNEKIPYYDLNEILISSINYLGKTSTIYSKNNEGADFYCIGGKKKNLFDEICLNQIFKSLNEKNDLIKAKEIYENLKKFKEILKISYSDFFYQDFFENFNQYISKPSSINLALKKIIEIIIKSSSGDIGINDSKNQILEKSKPKDDIGNKFIIIISDGNTKENQTNINTLLKEAKNNNITIITVLLTTNIKKKIFYDKFPEHFNKKTKYLFDISSRVNYKNPFARYFIKKNFNFQNCESNLCLETSMNGLCEQNLGNDIKNIRLEAIDIKVGDLNFEFFIEFKYKFLTKYQLFGTCWANACSAALFLSNKRIIGKKLEAFETFREKLIKEISKENIDGLPKVDEELKQLFRSQRLYLKEIDEDGAKEAIKKGRFVICSFVLSGRQWDNWSEFFLSYHSPNNNNKLLTKNILNNDIRRKPIESPGGHMVLLIEIEKDDQDYIYKILNSWGANWADGGTFKVKNLDSLAYYDGKNYKMPKLYDIFFYENELTSEEKDYYHNNIKFFYKCLFDTTKQRFKSFEEIKVRMNDLKKLFFNCSNCHESMRFDKLNEFEIYRKNGLYEINCPYCNSNNTPEMDLRELLLLKDLMDDGNKDFDINFQEEYYIDIKRVSLHKNFESKINNISDICSIGLENQDNSRIDSFFTSQVNCIIYLENLKMFMACDSRTILFINTNFKPIAKINRNNDLRTLCDLNLKHNNQKLNWIASGGDCLVIYEINEIYDQSESILDFLNSFIFLMEHPSRRKKVPNLQVKKKFDDNRNINNIIVLNNQEIMGRIAVCDGFGFIGFYNFYNLKDIQFSFKMQCHSYINCILYLSEENILVSGCNRERNLKFWRIQETKRELELVNSFDNIYSTISSNSLLNIDKKLLVGQKNGIRVFHHEQGIIRNYYFFNNEELGDEFGGVFSIRSLGKNYFICGRAFGFCSIFLLREKSIRKINIFKNNNASVKPYNLIKDNYYIIDICVKETSENEGIILISSVDKTLKVYSYTFSNIVLENNL